MKAIGFNQTQLGDLVISTVAARAFKQMYPGSHLTLGVNKKHTDILPLFYQHPFFDNFHLFDAMEDWPNEKDISYLLHASYDYVFNAMPKRPNESNWWMTDSQTQNICRVHGLNIPEDTQCILNPWFAPYIDKRKDYVALNWIGGFYSYPNEKSFFPEKAQKIVDFVRKLGYKTVCLGHPDEPALNDTDKPTLSLFETVKTMLGCRALIGVDSFLTWAASAYSFPCVASYSDHYYGKEFVKNIQPIQPNGHYLSATSLNDIPDEELFAKIEEALK